MRIVLLLISVLLLASCQQSRELSLTGPQKEAILTEISKLMVKSQEKTLTQQDIDDLIVLFQKQDVHGLDEIQALFEIHQYGHIAHSLSFLGDYVNTGKELLCPPHHIGHYFLFASKGKPEQGAHGLEEASKDLSDWEEAVRIYDAKYPSGKDIDTLFARVREDLSKAQTQEMVSEEEIAYLINDASICVYDEH
jgi:hypothetical protein